MSDAPRLVRRAPSGAVNMGIRMICRHCRHWLPIGNEGEDAGECRRFPPQVRTTFYSLEYNDRIMTDAMTEHPVTGDEHWCGEWAQRRPR